MPVFQSKRRAGALAALLASVIVIDLALRLSPDVRYFLADSAAHCPADFYLRLCPNVHETFRHPAGFSYTLTTTANGERITSAASPRPGAPEVWIAGDSISMGYGVSDDETAAWLLQRGLPDYAVRNIAVDAVGPRAMKDLLNHTAGAPSAIYWMFNPSDFLDDSAESALASSSVRRILFRLKHAASRSAVFAALRARREAGRRDAYVHGQSGGEGMLDPSIADFTHPAFAQILALRDAAIARSAQLCIVLYADVQAGTDRPERSNAAREAVAEFARKNGLCTIDARPDFLAAKENLYLAGDGHPGPAAQRIFADVIRRSVLSRAERAESAR